MQYYALLSQALRPTLYEMKWCISLTEGWHAILAGQILNGGAFMWPDPKLSAAGRQMLSFRDLREQYNAGAFDEED